MTENAQSTEPPACRGWLRRLFSWRTLRRVLYTIGTVAALVAILVGVEDWRGARAWRECRAALEARGEVLDLNKFIPPPIRDDQNFAATPLLREIFTADAANHAAMKAGRTNEIVTRISRIKPTYADYEHRPTSLGDVFQNHLADIESWARHYRGNTNYPQAVTTATPAEVVLAALGQFDPELDELRAAAKSRPLSRFDVNYNTNIPVMTLVPHITAILTVSKVLMLHATANLEVGKSDHALADLKLMLRLADSMGSDSMTISHLVGVAAQSLAAEIVQEGLVRHAWSDAQLAEIEQAFAPLNILAGCKQALRGERAYGVRMIDDLNRGSRKDWALGLCFFGIPQPVAWLAPRGWADYNKANLCQWEDAYIVAALDENTRRVYPRTPDQAKEGRERWETMSVVEKIVHARRMIYAQMFYPGASGMVRRSAQVQTAIDEARIACALERHRLAHGAYPDSLEALAPTLIDKMPHDNINGEPLKYRREGDAGYVLYSVGWNEVDDGGKVVLDSYNPPRVDERKGDWVWRFPPTPDKQDSPQP